MAVPVASEESNVERAYEAWDRFQRRDAEGFMAMCTPDLEFTTLVAEMEGRIYRGADGVREWWANIDETFDEFSPEVVNVEDLDDAVLAEVLIRGKVGDLPLENRAFQLVEIEDGLVRRWSWYRSREEAIAAAGEGK